MERETLLEKEDSRNVVVVELCGGPEKAVLEGETVIVPHWLVGIESFELRFNIIRKIKKFKSHL